MLNDDVCLNVMKSYKWHYIFLLKTNEDFTELSTKLLSDTLVKITQKRFIKYKRQLKYFTFFKKRLFFLYLVSQWIVKITY